MLTKIFPNIWGIIWFRLWNLWNFDSSAVYNALKVLPKLNVVINTMLLICLKNSLSTLFRIQKKKKKHVFMNKMLNKSGKLYERLYKNFQYIDRNKIGKC